MDWLFQAETENTEPIQTLKGSPSEEPKYTVNGLPLHSNVASDVLTQIELDCSTGLILNVNM